MVSVEKIYKMLLKNEVDFFTGIPDSLLQNICAYITDKVPQEKHIIAANEGVAIALASGYYIASGKLPMIYMQNSGLGNTINPLLSLADEKVYSLPLLLMIGWRGEPGTKDEPQHKKQGEVTISLLEAMNIPYIILDKDEDNALNQIEDMIVSAKRKSSPHAIVIRKDTFHKYKLKNKAKNDYSLSREEAMKLIVDHLQVSDIVISTTGKLSRELFEYREAKRQGHQADFLTVGSMGHSSSIALSIALEKPNRNIFCFDGDGALIMHMGAISNIGKLSPANYYHILFNNGVHESVGGQPTAGFQLNIPAIAKACGYKSALVATNKKEVISLIKEITSTGGPALLEIRVNIESRENLGRPNTTPIENRECFMNFVSNYK